MTSIATVAEMVREAERYTDDTADDRLRAIEYYQGKMVDVPYEEGRSRMVTRDVRAHVKKVLPSVMRTIFGSDEVVEFQPSGPGDEEGADQASDYINRVVMEECGARKAVYSAIHDALLLRNGILKWWFEEKQCVKFSKHTGLTDDEVAILIQGEGVEVIEHDGYEQQTDLGPVMLHDVKIKRTFLDQNIKAAAVAREDFLIHPDALSIEEATLVGEKTTVRRSDLIAMGYDRDLIEGLSLADDDDYEEDARRDKVREHAHNHRANDLIDYYDVYARVDMDDDGIAELRHMCFAGGLMEDNLLLDEECDEVQLCDIAVMRQPHQWEAISLADDLMDIQRGKTVFLRQTLDNLYWQNNPQPIMGEGDIVNPDAVHNPEFGLPIKVRKGVDVRTAMGFNTVPFVAKDSFGMMEYLDQEAQDRTGVSDASAGLAPDALQNMTAKASAMIEQAGIGQTEMMVRTIADGLQVFFKGLLKLAIRHQDKPRTVRLRDEWVTYDPRHWNASMDCKVNTGLGAGTRERDMMMMQQVITLQEKMLAGFGPDNPFVKPENVSNAVTKLAESAGLKTPSLYFTEPDPEEIAAKMEAMRNAPDPEQVKMEMQMQIEQAKMQNDMQKAEMQMQVQRDKEAAQMEADLQVKRADIEAGKIARQEEFAAQIMSKDRDVSLEREKMAMQEGLKRLEIATKARIEAAKLTDKELAAEVDALATDLDSDGLSDVLRERPDPNRGILEAMARLTEVIAANSGPRAMRVVKDEDGEIIGAAPEVMQ